VFGEGFSSDCASAFFTGGNAVTVVIAVTIVIAVTVTVTVTVTVDVALKVPPDHAVRHGMVCDITDY